MAAVGTKRSAKEANGEQETPSEAATTSSKPDEELVFVSVETLSPKQLWALALMMESLRGLLEPCEHAFSRPCDWAVWLPWHKTPVPRSLLDKLSNARNVQVPVEPQFATSMWNSQGYMLRAMNGLALLHGCGRLLFHLVIDNEPYWARVTSLLLIRWSRPVPWDIDCGQMPTCMDVVLLNGPVNAKHRTYVPGWHSRMTTALGPHIRLFSILLQSHGQRIYAPPGDSERDLLTDTQVYETGVRAYYIQENLQLARGLRGLPVDVLKLVTAFAVYLDPAPRVRW